MRRVFGVFGVGRFAKEVVHFAGPAVDVALGGSARADVYLVARDGDEAPATLHGVPVIGERDFLAIDAERWYTVAISDSRLRARIVDRVGDAACPLSLLDGGARLLGPGVIDEGTILCPFALVSTDTRLGRFVHVNYQACIAHDCTIGDFVTFAPGATCNGNVVIGDHAYIGSGAVIRNGSPNRPLSIGAGATIGMGAVVICDVPAGAVVVGNPARPIRP
jgi:sugar O-acyltransferase (sialic acid O-acetyltransferase NeuD family)